MSDDTEFNEGGLTPWTPQDPFWMEWFGINDSNRRSLANTDPWGVLRLVLYRRRMRQAQHLVAVIVEVGGAPTPDGFPDLPAEWVHEATTWSEPNLHLASAMYKVAFCDAVEQLADASGVHPESLEEMTADMDLWLPADFDIHSLVGGGRD